MKNILVIDTGSSSMRGLLFDEMGTILVTARRTYQMRVPDEETAVQDAEDFRNSLEDICREIADRAGEMGLCVDGISLTSQRSSVIPLDREGKPLAEAMMWYDHRAQSVSYTHLDVYKRQPGDCAEWDACGGRKRGERQD